MKAAAFARLCGLLAVFMAFMLGWAPAIVTLARFTWAR